MMSNAVSRSDVQMGWCEISTWRNRKKTTKNETEIGTKSQPLYSTRLFIINTTTHTTTHTHFNVSNNNTRLL
jgi:hypothetical protein